MPSCLIITTAGINCDRELAFAFEMAGASTETVHLNRLIDEPNLIDPFDLIGLPGGFSFGDAIAAGRVAAVLMRRRLYPAFVRAIERGVLIIAPCNGFQIVAQMGLLPGPAPGEPWPAEPPRQSVTLAPNESSRFIDRWCGVEISPRTRCVWTQGLGGDDETAMLPVAHVEGRFVCDSPQLLKRLAADGQIAVSYRGGDNPNGSVADVAGICDATGLVLGLMPHPERYTRFTHHPFWTRLDESTRAGTPLGLAMFKNAVAHVGKRQAIGSVEGCGLGGVGLRKDP